jgi:hypothetical protein
LLKAFLLKDLLRKAIRMVSKKYTAATSGKNKRKTKELKTMLDSLKSQQYAV